MSFSFKNFVEPEAAGRRISGPKGVVTEPRKWKHRKTDVNPYTAAAFGHTFSDDDNFQL